MTNCIDCKIEKELSEFYIRSDKKPYSYCKSCMKLRIRRYREQVPNQQILYSRSDRGKFNQYRRSALSRKYCFQLTFEQFAEFKKQPCYYCGKKLHVVGIDRMNNKLGYTLENSVSCCTMCNRMKMNHTYNKFLKKVEQIYFHLKAKEIEKEIRIA